MKPFSVVPARRMLAQICFISEIPNLNRLWVGRLFFWILSPDSGIINTQRLPLWNMKRNVFKVTAFVCQTGGPGKVMQ